MPKIFLIKNRLLQQQQKLLENQKSREELSPPGSPLADPQPLSLIVNRNQDAQNLKKEEESFELRTGSPDICGTSSPASPGLQGELTSTPRRFISSILGGDVPYGSSRGHHVLTSAEKKEYLPTDRPEDPKPHPKCQQVSVIQRTPSLPSKPDKPDALMVIEEPEQDAPIDYHVPKKDPEKELEEIKRNRIALAIKRGHQVLITGRKLSSAGQILMAAAGPSRTSGGGGGGGGGSGGGQQGGGGGGSRGGGGSSGGSSYTLGGGGGGGLSSGNSGGSLGGGGPGGAGGGGGPGKPNYGPSSPPTGSLPPFYESLKGGGLHGYTTQQYGSQYQSLMAESLAMDCDTGQDLHNSYPPNTGGGDGPPKQYSLLQNVCATYGICVKEEDDLSSYVKDQSFLPYDDPSLMVDPMSGAVVDPLQFTATLTFSSPADHTALIESLSDAADLILRETTENMPPPVEPSVNPFPEHRLGMQQQEGPSLSGNQQQTAFSTAGGRLPPGYCDSIKQERGDLMAEQDRHSQQLQIQQPKQNKWENSSGSLLSPGLSSLELDSSTSMSLPSPTSCSLDGTGSLSPPPPPPPPPADLANIPSLQVRVGVLQHRLGLPGDTALEFVNGGHGIKNPLANQDTTPVPRHSAEPDKVDTDSKSAAVGVNGKFTCHLCSKTFSLQRLLNRHMKCHSDVKRYLCTFCGKGFNDTFDLKRHTRTHTGVRPYKCNLCEKSFTQRCSLESHCLKVHGVQHQYAYKERRTKMYVCEDCGHTTNEPEVHYLHLKDNHPYSPALLKFYDKRTLYQAPYLPCNRSARNRIPIIY